MALRLRQQKHGHRRIEPASLVGAVGVQTDFGDGLDWLFKVIQEKSKSSVFIQCVASSSNGGMFEEHRGVRQFLL